MKKLKSLCDTIHDKRIDFLYKIKEIKAHAKAENRDLTQNEKFLISYYRNGAKDLATCYDLLSEY